MARKLTYEELEKKVIELEKEASKRKQAEEKLEKHLESLLHYSSLAIVTLDDKHKIISCNRCFENLFQFEEPEIMGKNLDQVIAQKEYMKDAISYTKKTLRGEVIHGSGRRYRKDGTLIDVQFIGVPVVIEGKVAGVYGIYLDITERKHDEKNLLESEERYRRVFENTGTATVIIEEDMTISMANTEFEKLSGYSKEEVEGKIKWTKFVVKEDLERMKEYHDTRRENRNQAPKEYEFRFIDKQGNKKDILNTTELFPGTKKSIASLLDITTRKKTEQSLRESERKLSIRNKITEIFLTIPDDEMYREVLQIILEVTDSKYGIFGYIDEHGVLVIPSMTRDIWDQCQVPDKTILYPPETWGGIWGRALTEKRALYANQGLSVPKGHVPVTKVVVMPIMYHGDVIGLLEIANKETDYNGKDQELLKTIADHIAPILHARLQRDRQEKERKQAEEALQQSEEKYRTLVENSFDGIFVQKEPKIIFTNQRLNEMLGYEKDELIGLDHWILYHPDYQKITRERAQSRMRGEKVTHQYEVKLQRKDGSWLYGEVNAKVINLEGEPGIQVWVRDITTRKQSEEALKESEEKYRLLVKNATDAIFIAQDEVVKFPNPKTEEMIGYTKEELATIPFVDLIYPGDRFMVLERYRRRLKGEDPPSTYSFRIISKSGDEVWVQLNTVVTIWEGRPATLNFLRDITEQRRLESQLHYAQRMEALGTLAGGIAHDFNNLLMGIQGNASLMLLDKDTIHPDYEKLKNIEHYVQDGADLTKQLLGFARGGRYNVKSADLNKIVKKSSDMFGRTKKEITIHTKYQKNIWASEIDQAQIEQVLLNLYVNAWQAMPAGGEIYLETQNVTLDKDYVKQFNMKPGRFVKISIADTGVGMDEETRQRIFEPFFTTKEMGRGTGLGLASVYGIIKNHGGIINVYSEKGMGTTFTIYLPATEKKPIEEKELPKEIQKGTETVLLVDDEERVLDVGEQILTKLGYTVLTARGGKEAIQIYERDQKKIDLVILDLIMPGNGGDETYDRMKEINPDIKILLSSGYSIDGQATEILKRGCDGFIQKPFTTREISQRIREILDKE